MNVLGATFLSERVYVSSGADFKLSRPCLASRASGLLPAETFILDSSTAAGFAYCYTPNSWLALSDSEENKIP